MALPTLVADLRHMTARWDDRPWQILVWGILSSGMYPQRRAVVYFRSSQWAWRRHLRPLALWFKARAIRCAGVEIHPAAEIGPGLCIAHGTGIVIGHDTVVGRDLLIFQGVTLGHGPQPGQPQLGDRVTLGAGATLLGGIRVGDGAKVGANAVVLADVAPEQTVVGIWKGQADPRGDDPG